MTAISRYGGGRLEDVLAPWLDTEGVEAAALISADGLVVSWMGVKRFNGDAIAAHVASLLGAGESFGAELNERTVRLISLSFGGNHLVLAPLNGELTLLLIGTRSVLSALAADLL